MAINIIIIPRPRIACGRDTVVVVLVSWLAFFRLFYWIFISMMLKRMLMQCSHTCTVSLCFLACKTCLFWSIVQEISVKTLFLRRHIVIVGRTLCVCVFDDYYYYYYYYCYYYYYYCYYYYYYYYCYRVRLGIKKLIALADAACQVSTNAV